MTTGGCVYVPRENAHSLGNLERGLDRGSWGWKDSAVSRASVLADIQGLVVGAPLLFAYGGPQPRVPAGGWDGAVFDGLAVCRVTGPYYYDTSALWEDDVYPHRVGLDLVERWTKAPAPTSDVAEALRLSANKQGGLVPADVPAEDMVPMPPLSDEEARTLTLTGDTDSLAITVTRKEQAKLRKHLFGNRPSATCAFCNRTLPSGYLRAAHV